MWLSSYHVQVGGKLVTVTLLLLVLHSSLCNLFVWGDANFQISCYFIYMFLQLLINMLPILS